MSALDCRAFLSPRPKELSILAIGLQQRIGKFRADKDAALRLVSVGDYPRDPKLDVPELAAYTLTASILLNMDEAINKP